MKKFSSIVASFIITLYLPLKALPDCSSTATTIPNEINLCCNNGLYQSSSQTFMFTHPLFQRLFINQNLRQTILYNKCGMGSTFELTGGYQQSQDPGPAARYFLLNCKNIISVSGDDVTVNIPTRDIRAEWLGLSSNFNGKFSIAPTQTQYGGLFYYHQNLSALSDSSFFEGWWVSVYAPVTVVKNNLNLTQNIFQRSSTFPHDLIEALNQPEWLYAHFCPNSRQTAQLAEINIKLGSSYLTDNHFILDYYTEFSIPSSAQNDPRFIFDPVAGNNGHVGYGGGVTVQIPLTYDTCPYPFCFFLGLDSLFLIRQTQLRTLDLWYNPWSRYLQLTYKNGTFGNSIPAVNVLTREVRSRPYGIFDFSTGLRLFAYDSFEIELGYSLWGHATEVLELRCPFPEVYGILGDTSGLTPADLSPGVYTVTASKSTIKTQRGNLPGSTYDTCSITGKPTFIPIKEADLDLNSGASQHALNHQFHIAVGVTKEGDTTNFIVGGGAFFEWPKYNSALQLVGVWAKMGAAF